MHLEMLEQGLRTVRIGTGMKARTWSPWDPSIPGLQWLHLTTAIRAAAPVCLLPPQEPPDLTFLEPVIHRIRFLPCSSSITAVSASCLWLFLLRWVQGEVFGALKKAPSWNCRKGNKVQFLGRPRQVKNISKSLKQMCL